SRERHRDLAPHGASPVAAEDHDGREGMDAGRGGGPKARRRERASWSRRGHPGAHRRTDRAVLPGGPRYPRHYDVAPPYPRRTVSDRFELPADLARFFVARARRHGGMPLAEAQTARNRRALAAARDP